MSRWQKNYQSQRFDRFFREHLEPGNKRFIELGGGGSQWLGYFNRAFGYRVMGIDYLEAACVISRRNLVAVEAHGIVICGDIFALPFKENSFDIVFSSGLIEHFKDPESVLQSAYKLLGHEGNLITIVPNKYGLPGTIDKILHKDSYDRHIPMTASELKGYHHRVGLKDINSTYIGSFGLGAKAPKGIGGSIYRITRKGLNLSIYTILKIMHFEPEGQLISPAVICVGRKP